MIFPRVTTPGSDDPANRSDQCRQNRRDPAQPARGRNGRHDLVPHRLSALIGNPEIELEGLANIGPKLHPERLIKTKSRTEIGDFGGRNVPAPEERPDRVGLDYPKENEIEHQNEHEGEERTQHLLQDEAGSPRLSGCSVVSTCSIVGA